MNFYIAKPTNVTVMLIFIASDNIDDVIEFETILNGRSNFMNREDSSVGIQCLNYTKDELFQQTEGRYIQFRSMHWFRATEELRDVDYTKAVEDILNLKTESEHKHLKEVIEYFKSKNVDPTTIKFITLKDMDLKRK